MILLNSAKRSQACRVLSGLEKFKYITPDSEGIMTAGQAFCDEVFRVWKAKTSK